MFVTVLVELCATYIYEVFNINNYQLYNFFTTLEFVFYLWFLSVYIQNQKIKKAIIFTAILLVGAIIINILFFERDKFHSKTFLLGGIIIFLFCFFYLYENINKHDIAFRIEQQPVFWVVIGLLLFYLVGSPLILMIDDPDFSREKRFFFSQIIRWLNVLLYGCFSVAFLLCPPPKTTY
jgi:hypothetical protein